MVIVKSKIDFATSMRRIFQSMAGKIFDFQCKRQRKVVKIFIAISISLFVAKRKKMAKKGRLGKQRENFPVFRKWAFQAAFGYPMLPIKAFCRRALSRAVLFLQ